MSVSTMANESPNMTVKASGPHVGLDAASGIMPITVVTVVRTMGRKRVAAESTTMSMSGFPG